MMKRMLTLLCAFVALTLQAQSLQVSHLSATHSQIRVTGSERYVLLPVQEGAPSATMKVLVDTREEQSLSVQLAVDAVDYYVPLDVSRFAGRHILLDVVRSRPRNGEARNGAADLCWSQMRTASAFDRTNREAFRPTWHFSPAYGWMNDPNGLVYKDGEWHLFFQYNPYGSMWGNMTWGHAVSRDLVHWEELPPAIWADPLGSVFSGSAVVDPTGAAGFGRDAIVAMYTSAGTNQTQSLAGSTDGGRTFTKYAGNPVITADIPDFRDPKMFFDARTGRWNVVLASGQEVRFYSSDDFRNWTYESSFGTGYGAHGGVWECPDLVKLPFEGREKYVLIVNINPGGPFGGSATQYFVGDYDGHRFIPDEAPEVTRWMDYGKDHYATVTWSNAPDGRIVAIPWMSNWQYANAVPTRQFRSANGAPRDLSLVRSGGAAVLRSAPSPELLALRGPAAKVRAAAKPAPLFATPRQAYELVVRFTAPKRGEAAFVLSNAAGEQVRCAYDAAAGTFTMDRTTTGASAFSEAFPAVTVAPTTAAGRIELRILVDACSIEAFGPDFAMTNLVFPSVPYDTIRSDGSARLDVTVYPLAP